MRSPCSCCDRTATRSSERPRTRPPPSRRPCRFAPGAILLDVNLPDHDGFWVAEALTDAGVTSRILLTSSAMTDVPAHTLERVGAVAFVPKIELATTDLAAC